MNYSDNEMCRGVCICTGNFCFRLNFQLTARFGSDTKGMRSNLHLRRFLTGQAGWFRWISWIFLFDRIFHDRMYNQTMPIEDDSSDKVVRACLIGEKWRLTCINLYIG